MEIIIISGVAIIAFALVVIAITGILIYRKLAVIAYYERCANDQRNNAATENERLLKSLIDTVKQS